VAYQAARSYRNNEGDFAGSVGFTKLQQNMILGVRGRYIGENFDADDVGFVPWKGTAEMVGLGGPRWYFEEGAIRSILIYTGPILSYEKVDEFTDYGGLLGFNMQLRPNFGYEINYSFVKAKDLDIKYNSNDISFSSWGNIGGRFFGNIYGGYSKTYNFNRDYLAYFANVGSYFSWNILPFLEIGTTFFAYFEGNPEGNVEEVTYNARPNMSFTPINNMNIRIYVDNLWTRNKGKLDQVIAGLLFSYNFSPKSWIYLAINDVEYRPETRLRVQNRAMVFKLRYLYYL